MRATLCVGRRSLHILHIFDRGCISDRPPHAAIKHHACWYVARAHVEDTILLYYTLHAQNPNDGGGLSLDPEVSAINHAFCSRTSLGECEPVRMLSVAVGVDPDMAHDAVKDCHVQAESMFNQAGSSSRMRSAFPVSLPCDLFDREAPHSYGQGGHSGEDRMP